MQQHVVSSTKRHWLRSPANNVKHLSIWFFPTCICRLNKLFISRRCIHYVLQYVPAKQQQQHVVEGFVTKVGKGCTHTLHGTTLPCVCKKNVSLGVVANVIFATFSKTLSHFLKTQRPSNVREIEFFFIKITYSKLREHIFSTWF